VNGMGIREVRGFMLRMDTPFDEKGNVCHVTRNEETVQMTT
jgi:hypothetical protein